MMMALQNAALASCRRVRFLFFCSFFSANANNIANKRRNDIGTATTNNNNKNRYNQIRIDSHESKKKTREELTLTCMRRGGEEDNFFNIVLFFLVVVVVQCWNVFANEI